MRKYDAILIGSGQAANPLAFRLAAKGWKIALIEKEHIGGTCVNEGCTPTKTLIASAKNAFQFSRAQEYGLAVKDVSVNMQAIVKRKENVVALSRNGLQKALTSQDNIDVIWGEAVFTGSKQVAVTGTNGQVTEYTAGHIFINTGARPAIPPIKGLDRIPFLTSSSIQNLQSIPAHLIIIGAGYIAIEFAQLFRRLGSQVTILGRSAELLSKEDADVAAEMKKILEEEGVAVITNAGVQEVGTNADGTYAVQINTKNKQDTITGSHVLVATGRQPNTDRLHLEKTGVLTDEHGFIKVNDKLETAIPGIYALGDVKGGPAFTHISYNDYLVVYKNIIEQQPVSIRDRPVPYCIFTDPEMARIGLNETEAREQKIPFKIAKLPMTRVARAIEAGESKGFMKAIVHAQTNRILGAVVIGAGGGELMSLLQIAMLGGITATQLVENIFAHPTYAEAMNNLFNSLSTPAE